MRRLALLLLPLFAASAHGQAILLPPVLEPPPPLERKVILPKLWTGGLEAGFNGAEGNSQNLKARFGGNVKRETNQTILKMDWVYTFAAANDVTSENRGLINARNEWIFPTSPWSVFVAGQGEMDQFKAYDLRLSMHAGLGYDFIKNETSLLKGRLGGGGSQEFGGPNKVFMWEGLAGFDVEHRFNERYKLVGSAEYFPDFTDISDYRLQAKTSLEVLIDPVLNLTLKIGVLNRYDSTPEGKKPNDVEYFGVLLWKF